MDEAQDLNKKIIALMDYIQERLTINVNKKNGNKPPQKSTKKSPDFSGFKGKEISQDPKYESLMSLINDLEFSCDERIYHLLEIIDERFIQALAKNKEEYYSFLLNLRNEFLDED